VRVLFWTEMFWPYIGGIEVLSSRLLLRLRARGHDMAVVTSHLESMELPDLEYRDGIGIHRLHFREPFAHRDPVGLARVRKDLARLKQDFVPDLIHLHFSGPSAYYHLSTSEITPCPCLITIHTWLPEGAAGPETLAARVLRAADWVTAVSQSVLENVRSRAPEVTPRSSVVYNGLEPSDVPPGVLPWDPPQLLCVGRLLPKKGFELAIAAMHILLRQFPTLRLIVAGDGPARAELEHLAASLDSPKSVEFAGWVAPQRLAELLNQVTVVVVPSRWDEPFCLVAVEAALMQRPVVAARVGGLTETVLDDRTGLLFPRGDSEALAGAIGSLLKRSDHAARLGLAGREHALKAFSLERAADDYDALYRRMAR
jgi:glycosyltransferase involved in cell wall biosynthesis